MAKPRLTSAVKKVESILVAADRTWREVIKEEVVVIG